MKTPQRKASALQSTAVAVVLSTSSSVFYFFSLSGGVGAESPSQRALTAGESELVTEFLDALVEISGVDERHHSFYTLSPEQRTELKAALEAAVRAGATRPDLLAALFDHHAVETHRRQKVDEAEPSTSSASASTRPENLRLRVEEDIQKKAQNPDGNMDSAIENLFPRFLANLCLVGQLRSLHPFAGVVHHQQEEQHAEEPVAAVALISPSFLTALSLVDERQRGAVFKALGKLRLDVSVNYVLRRLDAAVDPAAVGEQGGLLANANSARQRLQMVEKRLLTEAGELKTKKERRPGVYDTVEGAIGEPIAACTVGCGNVGGRIGERFGGESGRKKWHNCCGKTAVYGPGCCCYAVGMCSGALSCMPALRCYRRTVESHVDAAKFKRELKSSSEMRDFIKAQKALAEWILTELEKEHKAEEKTKSSGRAGEQSRNKAWK